MMKIKPLLPSLKEKKRYVVFELLTQKKLGSEYVWKGVASALQRFMGELGVAKAGPTFLANIYNPKHQRGILRVTAPAVDSVRAALGLIDNINGVPTVARVVGVSGAVKKAKEKFML